MESYSSYQNTNLKYLKFWWFEEGFKSSLNPLHAISLFQYPLENSVLIFSGNIEISGMKWVKRPPYYGLKEHA